MIASGKIGQDRTTQATGSTPMNPVLDSQELQRKLGSYPAACDHTHPVLSLLLLYLILSYALGAESCVIAGF